MKAVVFNPVAVRDLEELSSYIAQDNPVAAEDVRQDVLDTAHRLGEYPGLGIRPRFSAKRFAGIRFIPAQRYPTYLLFYRDSSEEVEVLRVLHGGRNLAPLFD